MRTIPRLLCSLLAAAAVTGLGGCEDYDPDEPPVVAPNEPPMTPDVEPGVTDDPATDGYRPGDTIDDARDATPPPSDPTGAY